MHKKYVCQREMYQIEERRVNVRIYVSEKMMIDNWEDVKKNQKNSHATGLYFDPDSYVSYSEEYTQEKDTSMRI